MVSHTFGYIMERKFTQTQGKRERTGAFGNLRAYRLASTTDPDEGDLSALGRGWFLRRCVGGCWIRFGVIVSCGAFSGCFVCCVQNCKFLLRSTDCNFAAVRGAPANKRTVWATRLPAREFAAAGMGWDPGRPLVCPNPGQRIPANSRKSPCIRRARDWVPRSGREREQKRRGCMHPQAVRGRPR